MLIDKDDAIKAVCEACYMYKYIGEHYRDCKYYPCDDVTALEAVSEAPKPSGDLISRADAIEELKGEFYFNSEDCRTAIGCIKALPSADAVSREKYDTVCEEYNRLVHNAICIKLCDENCKYEKGNTCYHAREHYAIDSVLSAESEQVASKLKNPCDSLLTGDSAECKEQKSKLESAEAVQGWIPCNERMPKELEAVNVTLVNHNPPCYYMDIMNVPFTATGVYHDGKWYWWDATVIDLLGEYGGAYVHGIEPIDKYIEILAWMPLPKPYKGGEDE